MTSPQANEVSNEPIQQSTQQQENTAPTTQQSTQQETQQTPQSFKVKHLHEEKEVSYDEAPTYIQKGMDYDRVKGKYEESKPVLDFVERIAKQNGMDVQTYLRAVEDYERQQEIENMSQQNNLSPELAEELYLLRQERQQKEVMSRQQQHEESQRKEYIDFISQFPDIKPEEIPSDVWEIKANNPHLSITDAYIRHEYKSLRNKEVAQKTNHVNADTSTGSVTGQGSPNESGYISYEAFESNRSNQSWVNKNYKKILESRAKW